MNSPDPYADLFTPPYVMIATIDYKDGTTERRRITIPASQVINTDLAKTVLRMLDESKVKALTFTEP